MRFGSVCSGIEAASVAWHPLGWTTAWLSEIEPFPCAVLKYHYPDVPNHGDMTFLPEKILSGEVEAPDLFCGGTPCQAFSVAGLRNSLDDARGNLSLTFVGIANAIDHVRSLRGKSKGIIFWENVPGVLNTKDNAFGCFLGALAGEDDPLLPSGEKWTNAGCVYGPQRTVAWRVLDAQYFGVAQRRRRVFVVASARDNFNPTEILFEFEGLRRDIAPSRKEGERIAPCVTNGALFSRTGNERVEAEAMVVGALCADSHPGSYSGQDAYTGRLIPQIVGAIDCRIGAQRAQNAQAGHMLPVAYSFDSLASNSMKSNNPHSGCNTVNIAKSLDTSRGLDPSCNQGGIGIIQTAYSIREDAKANTFSATPLEVSTCVGSLVPSVQSHHAQTFVANTMAVRRLTPTECERLQGFPDNYSNIPWRGKPESPDGPRYKALGNSWAVPVVRWIGQRIQKSETSALAEWKRCNSGTE